MRIFRKERESLRVKKIKASRAVFIDLDHQEIEITFQTEEGDILTLQLPTRLAHVLISEATSAYLAINPPLRTGSDYATWDGMNDGG